MEIFIFYKESMNVVKTLGDFFFFSFFFRKFVQGSNLFFRGLAFGLFYVYFISFVKRKAPTTKSVKVAKT